MADNTYKNNIDILDKDYSGEVVEAYNAAKQQLSQVRTANLEGPARALPSDLQQKLDNANAQFAQGKPQKRAELAPRLEELKKRHMIFLAVKIALIVFGLIFAFALRDAGAIGWIMVLAGIVCHFVFKSMDNSQSGELAAAWRGFFVTYLELFGHKETLHSPATGLYKEIDDLYLESLDDQARGFEMQQRQMLKQMEAQNEQHQQAMTMQAAQMAQMQEMVKEQKRTNRALFG